MVIGSTILLGSVMLNMASLTTIIISICIYGFGSGMAVTICAAGALSLFAHMKGSVGALYGFIQTTGLFLVSGIAAVLPAKNFITPEPLLTPIPKS